MAENSNEEKYFSSNMEVTQDWIDIEMIEIDFRNGKGIHCK